MPKIADDSNSQDIKCNLKELRLRKNFSQTDLANLVNIKRQAIYDIESGKYLPNTGVALKLARVLDCSVEDLFYVNNFLSLTNVDVPDKIVPSERLALAKIDGKIVAKSLTKSLNYPTPMSYSDALVNKQNQIVLSRTMEDIDKNIFISGCDPALNLLKEYSAITKGTLIHHFFASSTKALDDLSKNQTHIACIHFNSNQEDASNLAKAKLALPNTSHLLFRFALQQEGLMIRKGNPYLIKSVKDLTNKKIIFMNREKGSAIRQMLDLELEQNNIPQNEINESLKPAISHYEAAYSVACHKADASLGLAVIAKCFDLDFVPLRLSSYALVIPNKIINNQEVQHILNYLNSNKFAEELSCINGYDPKDSGKLLTTS